MRISRTGRLLPESWLWGQGGMELALRDPDQAGAAATPDTGRYRTCCHRHHSVTTNRSLKTRVEDGLLCSYLHTFCREKSQETCFL